MELGICVFLRFFEAYLFCFGFSCLFCFVFCFICMGMLQSLISICLFVLSLGGFCFGPSIMLFCCVVVLAYSVVMRGGFRVGNFIICLFSCLGLVLYFGVFVCLFIFFCVMNGLGFVCLLLVLWGGFLFVFIFSCWFFVVFNFVFGEVMVFLLGAGRVPILKEGFFVVVFLGLYFVVCYDFFGVLG